MSEKSAEEVLEGCAYTTMELAWLPISMTWTAFVATKLWEWFVVPQFAAKPLSLPVAIGLACLAGLWCKSVRYLEDERKASAKLAWNIAVGTTVPALTLLVGYIASRFV